MSVTGPTSGASFPEFDRFDLETRPAVDPDTDFAAGAAEAPVLRGAFAENSDLQAVFSGDREVGLGERGDAVQLIQERLHRTGVRVSGGFDGVFGRGTERALTAFQRGQGLPSTGRVDSATLLALQEAETTRVLPATDPLTRSPRSYLRTSAERSAYKLCEQKLFTGASWRFGLDPAVTDEDTTAVLDKLDTLPPASYSRLIHALAATRVDEGMNPTLLDKLIRRGTGGHVFERGLSRRFAQQLVDKLASEPEEARNILPHVSPDNADYLVRDSGRDDLVQLLGG